MFVSGKPFQPSLMFVDKARRLPLSGAPEILGNAPALPTNIRLGRKKASQGQKV